MYRFGWGVDKSNHTGIEWYTKAANQGNAECQYILRDIYKNEDAFKDLQKAVECFQKVVESNRPGAKDRVKELQELGYYAKQEQKGTINYFYLKLIIKNRKHSISRKITRLNHSGRQFYQQYTQ
jgi:TPR repeat protein